MCPRWLQPWSRLTPHPYGSRVAEKVTNLTAALKDSERRADDSARALRALESSQDTDQGRVEVLERDLKATKQLCDELEKKYEEANRRLYLTENDLEKAEERAEIAEEKAKAMEIELTRVSRVAMLFCLMFRVSPPPSHLSPPTSRQPTSCAASS